MTYAIISDIHGNIHALDAVLTDARERGVDKYIFLGDYYRDFPWPNEVCERIRGIDGAAVIRGNGEGYLRMRKRTMRGWKKIKQLETLYWNYKAMSRETLKYYQNLPETAEIHDASGDIHLLHDSKLFFRRPKITLLHSGGYTDAYEQKPFAKTDYLAMARQEITEHADVMAEIVALLPGVYLFGHSHVQFYAEFDGKVFINPGSCGTALDGDATAAYTLLSHDGNHWVVTERRVAYDVEAALAALRNSGMAGTAWAVAVEKSTLTGLDYFGKLLKHIDTVAKSRGESKYPVSNETYRIAAETWKDTL